MKNVGILWIFAALISNIGVGRAQTNSISVFAGNGTASFSGDNGYAINAGIGYPGMGVFDKEGNYYFSIRTQHRVRKISPLGIINTVAGTGNAGYNGDNIQAINAELNNPMGLAIDDSANVYIADMLNHRIRKINVSSGIITTVAGDGNNGYFGDNSLAVNASLWGPTDVTFGKNKDLFICDRDNQRIRRVDSFHVITTLAGTGSIGYNGDSILAANAELNGPFALCSDSSGNVYVSDAGNYRVRMINMTNGSIVNICGGTGIGFYNGDNILARNAEIAPRGLAIDKDGNLYVGDMNQRVRKIVINGFIHTSAGNGVAGYSGNGGSADLAMLHDPEGVSIDSCGNLFIAEVQNKRIRKVTFNDTCGLLKVKPAFNTSSSVSISPNPFYSRLNISSAEKVKEVLVIDLTGREVLRQSSSSKNISLDISRLSSGVYFVKITDERGRSLTKKVVKE